MATPQSNTITLGFSLGLLQKALSNKTSKSGRPKVVTSIRGDYFSSNCPLIEGVGVITPPEEAAIVLDTMVEESLAADAPLSVDMVVDYKTLGRMVQSAVKQQATYVTICLQKVEGIHQRVTTANDGTLISAYSVDMFDREEWQVTATSNPMAKRAKYTKSSEESTLREAVRNSAIRKRAGFDGWSKRVNENGQTVKPEQPQSDQPQSDQPDPLDELEDEDE